MWLAKPNLPASAFGFPALSTTLELSYTLLLKNVCPYPFLSSRCSSILLQYSPSHYSSVPTLVNQGQPSNAYRVQTDSLNTSLGRKDGVCGEDLGLPDLPLSY